VKKLSGLIVFLLLFNSNMVWAKKAPMTPSPTPTPETEDPANIRPGLSVGVGWPYAGLKYYFNQDIGTELRYATGGGINVFAARGYWSFAKISNFSVFVGLEAGYLTFDTALNADNSLRVSGSGYELAPLFGSEYFFSRQFSLSLDFSMPIVGLNSRNVSLGDLQWVLNGGLYFYPF